ncbi:unnamed protein product [Heterobilharzia americana]|nr:unnamed protein product [Heterobilharzia americana]CAH8440788.1 unnamed protein product [Heterobilharzia americana]
MLIITLLFHMCALPLATMANTTATDVNATESGNKSTLLYAGYTQLECLRLYSERLPLGYWSDLCNSNELLSPFQVWTTQSICAPGYTWYKSPRYWLAYEQPQFVGAYLLLSPGACIRNVKRYGLQSVASVLECVQISLFGYFPSLTCHYPQQPWRKYINYHMGMFTQKQALWSQTAATNNPTAFIGTVSLADLSRNSANTNSLE